MTRMHIHDILGCTLNRDSAFYRNHHFWNRKFTEMEIIWGQVSGVWHYMYFTNKIFCTETMLRRLGSPPLQLLRGIGRWYRGKRVNGLVHQQLRQLVDLANAWCICGPVGRGWRLHDVNTKLFTPPRKGNSPFIYQRDRNSGWGRGSMSPITCRHFESQSAGPLQAARTAQSRCSSSSGKPPAAASLRNRDMRSRDAWCE